MVVEVDGVFIGCGVLYVIWEDFGEVCMFFVSEDWLYYGVGWVIVECFEENVWMFGLMWLFCFMFEVEFFG